MPTIGTTSKPTSNWHAFAGTTFTQQEMEQLTMPEKGEITNLASWVGGWEGTCRVYLCIWGADLALLGSVGPTTVPDHGAGGSGDVELVTGALASPVRLEAGDVFYVGFDRHVNDGHQVSLGAAGTADHYEARRGGTSAPWPGNIGGATGLGMSNASRRIGSYVANYDPIAGGKVYRTGAWADADAVQVRRGAAWVDAAAVQVYRAGAWVDAE